MNSILAKLSISPRVKKICIRARHWEDELHAFCAKRLPEKALVMLGFYFCKYFGGDAHTWGMHDEMQMPEPGPFPDIQRDFYETYRDDPEYICATPEHQDFLFAKFQASYQSLLQNHKREIARQNQLQDAREAYSQGQQVDGDFFILLLLEQRLWNFYSPKIRRQLCDLVWVSPDGKFASRGEGISPWSMRIIAQQLASALAGISASSACLSITKRR